MFSTCLFCHGSLGNNNVVEYFPVGRRLAFDGAKGRLWVVCEHCARWNLTPLEERWEAIEDCERLFRGQRLRGQTEHIGLTKVPAGLTLIRIGQPQRPEFAAWRYGDVFGRRFKRRLAWIGGGVLAAGGGAALGLALGGIQTIAIAIPPLVIWGGQLLLVSARTYRGQLRRTYVPRAGKMPYLVFGDDISETDLIPGPRPGDWALNFRHVSGTDTLTGDAAHRALGILLARVNAAGASAGTTRIAAERIAAAGSAAAFIAQLARISQTRAGDFRERRAKFRRQMPTGRPLLPSSDRKPDGSPVDRGALPYFALDERLALEMALHEEDERRALEEEIGPLEEAWREAESIATIADDLLTPASARAFIAAHRAGNSEAHRASFLDQTK